MSSIEELLWHPVCDAHQVQDEPFPVKLLDQFLVLWRDQNGTVCGLYDQCPHRGARLSLGRICQGQLQCAYHGWTFEGQGHCTRVPALPRSAGIANADPQSDLDPLPDGDSLE